MQLYLYSSLFINCQPQIILSLFAIAISLEYLTMSIVGTKPAIPDIAQTEISNLSFLSNNFILLIIVIFLVFRILGVVDFVSLRGERRAQR